jgi:multiple sugar transport system substrate-binding protein/raffinose/stachyose/melibiose transport system substrate-binding protein
MKRILALAAMALASAVVLAQGSGNLVYNSNQSDPKVRAFDQKVVAMFKAKYPGIKVEHNTVDHETFQNTSIRTYLASDNPPDVLTWFAGNRMRAFSGNKLAADIGSVWKDAGWEKTTFKGFQSLSKDGNTFVFVPTNYYWWAVYYRKDIFQKVGLKEPKTWTEFLAACDTLNAAGITPIVNAAKETWPQGGWFDFLNMRTNGPEFHRDLTDGKIPYTDPRVKKTFENWKALLDRKCLAPNAAAYTWQDAANQMIQGKGAMYLMGDFLRDQYPDKGEANLDFFRFPIIDPKLPIGEEAPTDGYFIPAKAKNIANAKLFLEFLGSKEVAELGAKELGRLIVRNDINSAELYKDKPYIQKGLKEILGEADLVMQFYDRDTSPEMARIGLDGFVQFLSTPNQIDAILRELEAARARIFK